MNKELTVYERHYLNIIKAFKDYNLQEIKNYLFEKLHPVNDKEFIDTHSSIIDKVGFLRYADNPMFK